MQFFPTANLSIFKRMDCISVSQAKAISPFHIHLVIFTGLKLNGLTYNLLEVFKVSSNPFFANTAFMDLYKNYNEFATYYETISKLVSIKPKGELIELDATAKAKYIKEIENIKSQIPVEHKGEIYKGRIRIQ